MPQISMTTNTAPMSYHVQTRIKTNLNEANEWKNLASSSIILFRGTQWQFPPKYIENTYYAIQSPVRSLVMHCKHTCYKICICSVILGELESFWNYKGFIIVFPKILQLDVQSTPDNSNLQGKSKIVRVIGSSCYREFEENNWELEKKQFLLNSQRLNHT